MRKTITVDQYNITLIRKQFSEQLIAALADCGEIPIEHEAALLSKFVSVFTHFHNPHKDYGPNRLFRNDLKEALEKIGLHGSTFPGGKNSKFKRPASPINRMASTTVTTKDMEVIHYSPSLLYSTPVLTPLRLSIGK